MTNTERDQINRRFAELVGFRLTPEHEAEYREAFCNAGESEDTPIPVPDFISHPTLVLVEMMKREDWLLFAKTYFHWQTYDKINYNIDIPLKYILDTTGLLVKAAIEWLEKQEEV